MAFRAQIGGKCDKIGRKGGGWWPDRSWAIIIGFGLGRRELPVYRSALVAELPPAIRGDK